MLLDIDKMKITLNKSNGKVVSLNLNIPYISKEKQIALVENMTVEAIRRIKNGACA